MLKRADQEQTPYEKAKAVWDSRMGNALNQTRIWRAMTCFCLLLLGLSVAGNIYLGTQSKVIPYVVEVRPSGEASVLDTAVALKGGASKHAISFFLSRFVMLAREIPSDAVLIRKT